jgi:hypothetical protein
MPRVRQEYANEDGWSDWIHPLPGYRMLCCDCGLSHNLELKLHTDGKVYMRMKRNARSTAQARRARPPKANGDLSAQGLRTALARARALGAKAQRDTTKGT